MEKVLRNPDVMWRVEEEIMAETLRALECGEDIAEQGTSVLFSGGTMMALNLVGSEIWKICDGLTVEEIAARLHAQFEVEEDILREDVRFFLDELAEKGFVTYGE